MKDKFKNIDVNNEKLNRIINSAFEEFSKNKFEKASTNNIVKAAKVSRGLMYHYFTDKQELYDFLIEFSMTEVIKAFEGKSYWEETDIFDRLRKAVKIKLEVYMRYPYMMEFYIKALEKKSIKKIRNDLIQQNPDILNLREKIYKENIDLSKFKDDIDLEKAINVIKWTIERYSEEYKTRVRLADTDLNLETLIKEIDEYIDFLRQAFYK